MFLAYFLYFHGSDVRKKPERSIFLGLNCSHRPGVIIRFMIRDEHTNINILYKLPEFFQRFLILKIFFHKSCLTVIKVEINMPIRLYFFGLCNKADLP